MKMNSMKNPQLTDWTDNDGHLRSASKIHSLQDEVDLPWIQRSQKLMKHRNFSLVVSEKERYMPHWFVWTVPHFHAVYPDDAVIKEAETKANNKWEMWWLNQTFFESSMKAWRISVDVAVRLRPRTS